MRRFGVSPDTVGCSIMLGDEPFTIVGICSVDRVDP
jgi:hypothetical protein